jgi:hypothetical protein
MLEQLFKILHPQGELTIIGFYALQVGDVVRIKKGSATIGEWTENNGRLIFKPGLGVDHPPLESIDAQFAAQQTIKLVASLK